MDWVRDLEIVRVEESVWGREEWRERRGEEAEEKVGGILGERVRSKESGGVVASL